MNIQGRKDCGDGNKMAANSTRQARFPWFSPILLTGVFLSILMPALWFGTLEKTMPFLEFLCLAFVIGVVHTTWRLKREINAGKDTEQELYETQRVFRTMIENSPDIIARYDRNCQRTYVNPAYLRTAKLPSQELLATTPLQRSPLPETAAVALQNLLRKVLETGIPDSLDVPWTKTDNIEHWYNINAFPELDYNGQVVSVMTVSREITEHKRTEMQLNRLNRELHAISSCNQTLMHATDEKTLLLDICRIVCDEAGYRLAWVGYAERDEAQSVRPVAWAGHEEGYLANARITWADNEYGRGPTGTAIRTGKAVYFQDFTTQPEFAPWRESALNRGYRSNIALPLKDEHATTFGSLTIYSNQPDAFTPYELRLLQELADDLAYGITVLRARAESKRVTEAMQKSAKDLKEAQRLAKIGSWEWDAETDTISWSEEYYRIYGFDPSQRPPGYEDHLKAYTPESAARLDAAVKKNIQAGEPYVLDLELARKEGQSCWITARSETVRNALGKIVGLRGTAQDITERKRGEEEQARLATVIEQATETIVITDLNGTILYVNPAFEKITGYTRQESLGQNPRLLQSGRQDAAFYRTMWDTIKRGEVWHGHFVNKRKNGTFYEEDAIISPIIDTEGKLINYAAVKRDVTREMQLEQEVQQAQKMEAVGRLAGGIAHDFNNILQAILGFCEILLDNTPEPDSRRVDILEIRSSALRAAALTRQLLAFGRRQMTLPTSLDINTLITNTEKLLHRLIGEDIRIVTMLSPDIHHVRADAGQIEQVIMNLVVNARDAMPKGGKLTITTTHATVTPQDLPSNPEAQPGEFVCLSVADTGTGMTEDVQAHIFEPFFSTKSPGQGTGLGLAVVYGIVKQHNGWIHVRSQVGHGSTFSIFLPTSAVQEQPEPATPNDIPMPPHGHGEQILVVEDASELRNLAIRILQSAGYRVTAVESAESAEPLLSREDNAFDLVFTDVVLPGRSGFELAQQLQHQKPAPALLLCSGYTDDRVHWATITEQGLHCIPKPYTATTLLHTIGS